MNRAINQRPVAEYARTARLPTETISKSRTFNRRRCSMNPIARSFSSAISRSSCRSPDSNGAAKPRADFSSSKRSASRRCTASTSPLSATAASSREISAARPQGDRGAGRVHRPSFTIWSQPVLMCAPDSRLRRRSRIIVQIRRGQAGQHIEVQIAQVRGDLAALVHVERGIELADQPHCLADRLAFRDHIHQRQLPLMRSMHPCATVRCVRMCSNMICTRRAGLASATWP